MTTADHVDRVSIPTSRKVLCAVYAVIAFAALIGTLSQNLAYLDEPARFVHDFLGDSRITPASRFLFIDVSLFGLAVMILMVIEARKHDIKYVWLYIAGAFVIGASVTVPLFLVARELRLGATDAPHLRTTDTILLFVASLCLSAQVFWVVGT